MRTQRYPFGTLSWVSLEIWQQQMVKEMTSCRKLNYLRLLFTCDFENTDMRLRPQEISSMALSFKSKLNEYRVNVK